jgi:hypothetical protein
LQKGATTEHPALSVNGPPVQLLCEVHLLLLQPPLLPMSVPPLLHCASDVHKQYWCLESHTGAGDRLVTQA